MRRLPRIAVVTLGGTIASVAGDGGDGVLPTVTGDELVAGVPGLRDVADVEVTSLRQLPSGELDTADLVAVAALVERRLRDGCAGAVVVQGTDAMEETAFALDLLVRNPRPLVVTGAMRHPATVGADGGANLLAAVAVASAAAAHDAGCLVVMNDEIHAARHVGKRHTQSPAAFASPAVGPIGWVSEGQPRIALRPLGRAALELPRRLSEAPVALLAIGPADEPALVDAVPSLGYRGLVVETLGGGHVPARIVRALAAVARRLPVVFASRTGAGEVLRRTYGFAGSERDLIGAGAIPAGWLDAPKARVLLRLLLGADAPRDSIARAFARLAELAEHPVELLEPAAGGNSTIVV